MKKPGSLTTGTLLAALLSAASFVAMPPAHAQASAPQGGPGGRPPPEAIAACSGKAAGTQASFTDRGGRTVTGACTQMGDVLAVRPAGGPGGPPPPGASAPR